MSLTYYEIAVIAFTSLVFLGLLLISVVRGRDDHRPGNYSPHVTVIVPCRGKDLTLERNLRSLVSQDYGDYRVIAVVDSLDDPAVETIRRVGLELMVSDARCEACSGKVRAIATVLERVRSEVYVFADSDAEMPPNWLRDLVAPLGDSETGLSTTFPIFYPMGGFWSHVKMAWGLVGMGLMESRITRFGWGGSLAFRSEIMGQRELEFFKSGVSDDIAITKICKAKGLKLAYVKSATPRVNSDDDFSTFIEWSNRETALSISASSKIFTYGITFYISHLFLIAMAAVLSIYISPAFVILLLPISITIARNCQRAGRRDPLFVLCNLLVLPVYTYNLVKGRLMKEIVWRGRKYRLISPDFQ